MGSKVRDVMTPDPVMVSPEATLREVAETLSAKHISGVPVVAAGRGLVGVISASDLIDFIATEPGVPTERPDQTERRPLAGQAPRCRPGEVPSAGLPPVVGRHLFDS
jgi:CBS domain-containing protein